MKFTYRLVLPVIIVISCFIYGIDRTLEVGRNLEQVSNEGSENVQDAARLTAFNSLMSETEAANLRNLLRIFVDVANKANITYFMYWGTLLGSYRHHGRIPWDDEIDFMAPAAQKARLYEAFAHLAPIYVLNTSAKYRWKFYANNSTLVTRLGWKFPFVDISFYNKDNVSIWDEDPIFMRRNTFLVSDVFPLCLRPFDGVYVPAPRNPEAFVTENHLEVCSSRKYDHRKEKSIKGGLIFRTKCSSLWDRWPFVFRTKTEHGTNETLRIGSRILSWKFIASSFA